MVKVKGWISYHEYGTRAADACKQSAIDEIFSLPLIDAIGAAITLNDDAVIQAVITWNGFDENLDEALAIIRSAAYMQAHFHLQDLMAFEHLAIAPIPKKWLSEHVYPKTIKDLHPSPIILMVEILNESSMPSHAPTAAISAATNSII